MGSEARHPQSRAALAVFVAASLLPVGIALFTSLRNAARG